MGYPDLTGQSCDTTHLLPRTHAKKAKNIKRPQGKKKKVTAYVRPGRHRTHSKPLVVSLLQLIRRNNRDQICVSEGGRAREVRNKRRRENRQAQTAYTAGAQQKKQSPRRRKRPGGVILHLVSSGSTMGERKRKGKSKRPALSWVYTRGRGSGKLRAKVSKGGKVK